MHHSQDNRFCLFMMMLAFIAMASAQHDCAPFLSSISPPRVPHTAALFKQAVDKASKHSFSQPQRRVWDLIIFGYELDILQLHMQVLYPHVAGFLVSEASIEHQINRSKPTILSDALAHDATLPNYMRDKTTVTVLGLADVSSCEKSIVRQTDGRTFSTPCFEGLQRFATLRLLFARAGPDDLAISADVDEIARPEVISALIRCHPYGPHASSLEEGGGLVLQARWQRYGLHCDGGLTWKPGPKLFAVRWLRRNENGWASAFNGSKQQLRAASAAFTALRLSGDWSMPMIKRGGWHLTSFGGPEVVARKLNAFMHANLFATYNFAYLPACLEMCMGLLDRKRQAVDCREFLKKNKGRGGAESNSGPRGFDTQKRIGWQELQSLAAESEVPPVLITHRANFPPSWYAYLTA
mmetsp:Transcript_44222/g.96481  ORF Transcript_44222/g.96481 Transcript_44222/m.96481 type:complete len:410 (-) Transcript_44222:456-1685(-)